MRIPAPLPEARSALISAAPYWPCPEGYTSCRFTGSTNFVDSLQSIYGLPGLTNYAIGGARTDNTNTMPPIPNNYGLPYQLYQFAAQRHALHRTATSSRCRSAATICRPSPISRRCNQARSNRRRMPSTAAASSTTASLTGGVQQLVAAGARNIAWLSTGSSKWFPEPPVGAAGPLQPPRSATLWANTYYQQTQQLLAPLAQSGVRIFLFNFGILQERVANNPGQYGFASATACEQGIPHRPVRLNAGITFNLTGCFYNNSVHPTGAAMALIAPTWRTRSTRRPPWCRRAASPPASPRRSPPPCSAASTPTAPSSPSRPAAPAKSGHVLCDADQGADRAVRADPGGETLVDLQRRQLRAAAAATASFSPPATTTTPSAALSGSSIASIRTWRVGGVFGYSEPNVSLGVQNAHNHINAYQFAAYGSFTDANWFADALVAYGRHDFALDRAGVIDTVRASTHANTFTAAARGGYLVDVGPVRAGPIAGLNYTHAVIDGYTETGDILLTMMVDRQALDALTGSAGLQVRYPFLLGNGLYSPFVNVTAEHDFLGSGRIVTTTLVTAPLLPVLTPVPDNGSRTYGKVAAGIAAAVADNVSATLTAATSFAREGGNDFARQRRDQGRVLRLGPPCSASRIACHTFSAVAGICT